MQPLNLARKWRSKTFDQLIGQELPVKMLKNSLYRGHFVPVYLFSGQRGCGKTSTARVFAAAVNCQALPAFQKAPRECILPCLECSSCIAMVQGKHPDFIEIDAASHTGVDNIRTIIESSSLLPLMGRKKIYLIDEAHMLSKAAFNAFLKVLEEPPMSVLFILATTDTQKIIETVRSRCLQLFFKPIETQPLVNHLKYICVQENVECDDEGLRLIAYETEGSARDALNVLEQVRFAHGVVNKKAVQSVLGHIDDAHLSALLTYVLAGNSQAVVTLLHELPLSKYSADFFWYRFVELIRAVLWHHYHIEGEHFMQQHEIIAALAQQSSPTQLTEFLAAFAEQEASFLKTTRKHILIEILLLQLCCKKRGGGSNSGAAASLKVSAPELPDTEEVASDEQEQPDEEASDAHKSWSYFVEALVPIQDPLVLSIFKQAQLVRYDSEARHVIVSFTRDVQFFQEWLHDTRNIWINILEQFFGPNIQLVAHFDRAQQEKRSVPQDTRLLESAKTVSEPRSTPARKENTTSGFSQERRQTFTPSKRSYHQAPLRKEPAMDVSDKNHWRRAHILLKHFSGTMTELKEGLYE